MKKIVVTGKEWAANEYSVVSPWLTETPFIAPFQAGNRLIIQYVAYAEWCGDNNSRNVKISAQGTALPPNWDTAASLGLTFTITLPVSWATEGFELGPVIIFVAQSASDNIFIDARINHINGNQAEIELLNIISATGTTPIETEEDSICFLQNHTPNYPPECLIVREGEQGAFAHALNPNASPFGALPGKGYQFNHAPTGSQHFANLPYWAQQWGVSSWINGLPIYEAAFYPYHTWAIQDGYEMDLDQNQPAYFTNQLRLLFGIKPDFYTSFKLRTAHVNCREDGSPTGGQVVLSGTNGNWTVNITPPVGGTLVAAWIALTNDEAAHQGASPHAHEMIQQSPHYTTTSFTDATTFTIVPPNPQALAVAVFDFGGQYGVRVSNRISILPPPSPLVEFDFEPVDLNVKERWAYRNPYPWDAVGGRVVCKPSLLVPLAEHPFVYARWWAFVRTATGQTWMLEDAEFNYPPLFGTASADRDVTQLYQFANNPGSLPQAATETDLRIYLPPPPTLPLKEHYLRTYAAVYTQGNVGPYTLAPTSSGPIMGIEIIFAVLVQTPSGLHYAENNAVCDFILPFTAAGTFNTSLFTWTSPPTPPLAAGEQLIIEWRVALFKDEFSKSPIWQEDFQHTGLNPPTPPIVGPHPGGVTYTLTFDQSQAPAPGKYILFARMSWRLINAGNFANSTEFAEYQVVQRKREIYFPDYQSDCPPCIPALQSETVNALYLFNPNVTGFPVTPAGDAFVYSGQPLCDMPAPNCGYTIVSQIPSGWLDILLTFDNYISDLYVNYDGIKLRLAGTVKRVDDVVNEEKYVTTSNKEISIIRSFKRAYELTLFISSSCMMYQAELIKWAKRVNLVNQYSFDFLMNVRGLVPEDFKVRTLDGKAAVVTIRLVEEEWRIEHAHL